MFKLRADTSTFLMMLGLLQEKNIVERKVSVLENHILIFVLLF